MDKNSKNLKTGKLFTMLSVTQRRNERSMEGGRGKERQQIVRTDMILKATENRRTSGWFAHFCNIVQAVIIMHKMSKPT